MEFLVLHRSIDKPKWEYRSVYCQTTNSAGNIVIIYYYELPYENSVGIEVYTGKNYIFEAKNASWSRRYDFDKVPAIYKKLAKQLKEAFNKVDWTIISK